MKQVLVKQGNVLLANVPAPGADRGTVLVRVANSCISVGTEMTGVRASGVPLWTRALKQPEKARAALRSMAGQGLGSILKQIGDRVDVTAPTGYSASGTVVEVGPDVFDLKPGDRVACAGAQCAFHAEFIVVPRNLVTKIDDRVSFEHASTVTLGAIALQGVRRAVPTLGETFVVVGLGILGQLTVQLLRANGCRVIGVDLDPARAALAQEFGANHILPPEATADADTVRRLTDGHGADGVIITAATASDAVIASAFRMCRKKGRVVLVGDVGLNLNRADFYEKELDFFISSSYGPGRYDRRYEEEGLDYPIGYIRWTENRNMGEYLRLISTGQVELSPLISAVYPLDNAADAYAALAIAGAKPLMIVLAYPEGPDPIGGRTIPNSGRPPLKEDIIRIAVVGAGNFAKAVHLPNIRAMPGRFQLYSVVNRNGHNAAATAKRFGAQFASTDFGSVLADSKVDAVLVATRHDRHADMTLAALSHGKHVLVEKPLALTRDELVRIESFYAADDSVKPVLLTGFNRRFSPYAQRIAGLLPAQRGPMIINYRMNAGHIPQDNWVHGPEGGGRNRGEACHIYDLFTFLIGARVTGVDAASITPASAHYSASDNFVATMRFADGSVASLTYTSMGSGEVPKEHLELHCDGMTIIMRDYLSLDVFGRQAKSFQTKSQEKGQREELEAFAAAVSGRSEWPIQLWEQVQATEIAIRVEALMTAPISDSSAH